MRVRLAMIALMAGATLLTGCSNVRTADEEDSEKRESVVWESVVSEETEATEQDEAGEREDDARIFPRIVWEESFTADGKRYSLVKTCISAPYRNTHSEDYGSVADYQLSVTDEAGNLLWEHVLNGYRIRSEEVYWMLDVSGDGNLDFILCDDSEFVSVAMAYESTALDFFIWNSGEECFVRNNPPGHDSGFFVFPVWDVKHSRLKCVSGDNSEMYQMINDKWELCAEWDHENHTETFFENGEAVDTHPLSESAGTIWDIDDDSEVCLYVNFHYWSEIYIQTMDGQEVKCVPRSEEDQR